MNVSLNYIYLLYMLLMSLNENLSGSNVLCLRVMCYIWIMNVSLN
uniref:Uncharacterized protein n=1 Tax=Arundo donax TaxID=35708 RepID=A0A0A8ZWE1_ARUDO